MLTDGTEFSPDGMLVKTFTSNGADIYQQSYLAANPVTPENFHHLPRLIEGQSLHHNSFFSGKEAELQYLLFHQKIPRNKLVDAFYIYNSKIPEPIGYVLFSPMNTADGAGMNLHDIFISDAYRKSSKGAGSFAIGHLMDMARLQELSFIEFAVVASNKNAIAFYEKKCKAVPLPKIDYDLSAYLSRDLPTIYNPYREHYRTRMIASEKDLNTTLSGIGHDVYSKVLSEKFIEGLREASQSNAAEVIAGMRGNKTVALAINNINFYSDSCSLGCGLQTPVFFTDNPRKKKLIFHAILNSISERAAFTGWGGQLIAVADEREPWQECLMKEMKVEQAVIPDASPPVPWITYQIPEDVIYSTLSDQLKGPGKTCAPESHFISTFSDHPEREYAP